MATYKLESALWIAGPQEFENDKEAWESLRKQMPHKFARLYKQVAVPVKVINEANYVDKHNKKYGPKPIGYGPPDAELLEVGVQQTFNCWVPIILGITDDPYDIKLNTVQHE